MVRDKIAKGVIRTFHVTSNLQVVDIFTKALGLPTFSRLMNRLGLIDIFAPSAKASCSKYKVIEPAILDLRESVDVEEEVKQEIAKACYAKMKNNKVDRNSIISKRRKKKRLKRSV